MQQSNASNYNILNFGGVKEFQQNVLAVMGQFNTGELVRVTAVSGGGLDIVGFVSVEILTQRTDADNNNVDLGEIHNVPYFRITGGKNAVILDPQIGDIGFCGFCSRDISLVKRIRAMAAQNVSRYSDIADAFFFGGWSNQAPEQYIQFTNSGLNIKSVGDVNINGLTIKADGTLVLKDGSVVDGHSHGGVQSGNSNTSPLGG
jgi:hypothetical protein